MSKISFVYLCEEDMQKLKKEFPAKINQPFTSTTINELFIGFISNTATDYFKIRNYLESNDFIHHTLFMEGDTDVIINGNKLYQRH